MYKLAKMFRMLTLKAALLVAGNLLVHARGALSSQVLDIERAVGADALGVKLILKLVAVVVGLAGDEVDGADVAKVADGAADGSAVGGDVVGVEAEVSVDNRGNGGEGDDLGLHFEGWGVVVEVKGFEQVGNAERALK